MAELAECFLGTAAVSRAEEETEGQPEEQQAEDGAMNLSFCVSVT